MEERRISSARSHPAQQPSSSEEMAEAQQTPVVRSIRSHPWTQISLISFICFCLPGVRLVFLYSRLNIHLLYQMYNALSGMGGSGQVDSTVAANANVALLSTTAATALFIVGPIFSWTGPRVSFMVGGWTYALYSGSLLNFNRRWPSMVP